MKFLPPPTNFNEGQRFLFGVLMVAAGMFLGACAVGMTIFFAWMAFAAPANQLPIIYILAGSLAGSIVGLLAVLISMAVGGPVGRLKVSGGREGVSFEAADDEAASAPESEEYDGPRRHGRDRE